LYYDVSVVKQS